jgi:superfamily I DNA/RNA helicase
LRTGDPKRFLGTLEYFAEEGKYHYDGHRKCGVRLSPIETMKNKGLCPVCGRPVTIGVKYRVEELADRGPGEKPERAHPYTSILPLTQVLSEVLQVGPKSKKVGEAHRALLEKIGPEFEILRNTPADTLEGHGPALLPEAIKRMRKERVHIAPGFDGEFGTVSLFTAEERQQLLGQKRLFEMPSGEVKRVHKPESLQASLFGKSKPLTAQQVDPRVKDNAKDSEGVDTSESGDSATGLVNTCRKGHNRAARETGSFYEALPPDERLLYGLNAVQRDAVCHAGGPLLVVAGPGTGKTRTLTHRIAYLLAKGIAQPGQVLAVTFTNKAAQEMGNRLSKIVDDPGVLEMVTIRTFHALCLDIITSEAELLGMGSRISLVNEADRRDLVKVAIQEASALKRGPDQILNLVSLAKQRLLAPEADLKEIVPQTLLGQFQKAYKAYEQLLLKNQVLDFDDLIFKVARLFEANTAVREKYQARFSFISVDEYQDINYGQYRLIKYLAPPVHDICVIGDPNQAIYSFRGADVRYFHGFGRDYPAAKTIRLGQNYRSTETILQASGQLMVGGKGKELKRIWSGIQGSKILAITELPTEKSEAEYIVKTIDAGVGGISHFSVDSGRFDATVARKERSFADFAVLYRTKEQAKALVEAFRRSGIPFQSVGQKKLENRKGITELVSYLKAAWSLAWDLDVERILNFPARRINSGTIASLRKWAERAGCSLADAVESVDEVRDINGKAVNKLISFRDGLRKFKERIKGKSVFDQIQEALNEFGFIDAMSSDEAFEENVGTLLAVSRFFDNDCGKFLTHLALENEQDLYDDRAENVALMTMHASKGLEFPVVFIAGCEDGIIPYRTKRPGGSDVEEERRLFYVALTRAKEEVQITHVKKRVRFGKQTAQRSSPFLETIEEDLKEYGKPFSGRKTLMRKSAQLSLFDL